MIKKHNFLILLLIITFLGFVIRLFFFIGNNFPLHDGGFFYVMIQDLLSNKFILPDYSFYNHANIPFVYPPFGLYFVGLVEIVSGADRFQLFRIIPLLVSTLTIPAIYILAKEILKVKWASLAATIAMSLLPMGYKWLILGGGVTRAFGTLFSILALVFVFRFIQSGKWTSAVLGSMFCGLTVLSHPECAWFLFYSIGWFVIIELIAKKRKVLIRSFLVFIGTMIIILPWLLSVLHKHAETMRLPLMDSGFSRWNDIINFFLLQWSGEVLFPIFTLFALIGIFPMIKKKQWFIVFWLPLVFILQSRAPDQRATIPLALLAGVGIYELLCFLTTRFSEPIQIRNISIVACGIFLIALIGSMVSVIGLAKPLSEKSLESFEWIKREISADSKILVISGKVWPLDNYSEWMTALTGRNSVSLVQGYEWLPGFSDRISLYNHLHYEYSKGMDDLIKWMNQNDVQADYLILPKGGNEDASMWTSEPALHWNDALLFPGVDKVFENESVLILDLRTVIGGKP